MALPERDRFREVARTHRVVPVWRELLADLRQPALGIDRIELAQQLEAVGDRAARRRGSRTQHRTLL